MVAEDPDYLSFCRGFLFLLDASLSGLLYSFVVRLHLLPWT